MPSSEELDAASASAGRQVPGSSGRPGRTYQLVLVGLLSLTFGIVFFDRNALGFLMPFIQPDLGLNNTQVGLLAAALAASWAISGVLVSYLSDRLGSRKRVLVVATLVFASASALSGMATSFAMLFGARLLMGAADGGVLPVSQALLVKEVDPEWRGGAMGFMQNMGSNILGTFAAPIVLVAAAEAFGWRGAFYVAALPAFICAVMLWFYVREIPQPPHELTHLGVGRLLASFLDRNILICTLMAICYISYLIIGLVFLPLVLTQERGMAPEAMSWTIGLMGISAGLGGFLFSRFSDRVGRRTVLVTVPYLGLLVPVTLLGWHGSAGALTALLFLGWFTIGTFPIFLATVPSESVAAVQVASVIGMIQGVGEVFGGVLAPTVAGAAADRWGLGAVLWIMLGLAAVSTIAALGLRETAPARLRAQA